MQWGWHWHFLCVQVGAEMELLLDKRRSMQLWLLLHTNRTEMQHLKTPASSLHHVIVWVWNSNRARLGDSDALNGITRGHWVMFSVAAGLVCRGQGSFTHVQARLGFWVPLILHVVCPAPWTETGSGCLQPPKAWAWKLVCFGTFAYPDGQSHHRTCPIQKERA